MSSFYILYGCVDVILFQFLIKHKLSRLRVSLQTLEKSLKKKRNLPRESTKWCVLRFFTHTCAYTSENVLEMELLGHRVCFCYIQNCPEMCISPGLSSYNPRDPGELTPNLIFSNQMGVGQTNTYL